MTHPTKEEVEKWKYESAHSPLHDHAFENHNRLICIADAYLALREEVGEIMDRRMELIAMVEQLKAENQALREEVETQQCNIEVLTETKSQHARVIQELQAENQGLERCVVEKIDRIGTLAGKIQQLEADNEALRARLAQVEQASQRIIGNIIGEQTHGTY